MFAINSWRILKILSALAGIAVPLILFHKPEERCDCRCHFCDSWISGKGKKKILPAETVENNLNIAGKMGFLSYTLWGGEPLLVDVIGDYIKWAKRAGMETTL